MKKYQLECFINDLKIINNCNIERVKFLKKIIKDLRMYLLAWQRNELIKNIVTFNCIFPKSKSKFHLHETLLLNFKELGQEPAFIFKNYNNKKIVSSSHFIKLPKYQKKYLIQSFKSTKNIKLIEFENEVYFEINPILEIENNNDLLFLLELILKTKEIKGLINEAIKIKWN